NSARSNPGEATPNSAPNRGATNALSAASGTHSSNPASSFAAASGGGASSAIPNRWRTISPSAQYATPSPCDKHRPTCHTHPPLTPTHSPANRHPPRTSPPPPIPKAPHQPGRPPLHRAMQHVLAQPQLALAPHERRLDQLLTIPPPDTRNHPHRSPQMQRLGL